MARTRTIWVVAADGARARAFENTRAGEGLSEAWSMQDADAREPTRDLGADKPGRGRTSGTGDPYALQPKADWHDQAAERFLAAVAERLNRDAAENKFDQLVLAAPAKALGQLRPRLADPVRQRLRQEFDKDVAALNGHALAEWVRKADPMTTI